MNPSQVSDELKVWDGEGNDLTQRVPLHICSTHTKDTWMQGNFIDNHDGTVTCKFCPQGYQLPGYMRCLEGRIVDLRTLNGER